MLIMMPPLTNEVMIDGVPAKDIAAGMIRCGLIRPARQKTPEQIEAYKQKRRDTIKRCMQRLRDRRKNEKLDRSE